MSEAWWNHKEQSWEPLDGGDSAPPALEVVGHCSDCGSPIYGPKYLERGQDPACQYSCVCWMKRYVAETR